jgi:plastocyanin
VGFAGGASVRLNDYIALDGDVGTLVDAGRDAAWSAGISFVIPGSPHTFSLHAGNSASATIQGASFGVGVVTYGFEFTIPIHFSRFAPWFAKKERAVEVNVRDYRFGADSLVIGAGQSVGWINHDAVAHTVTFETSGPPPSGSIAARGTHVVTFTRPGVYRYHCEPHPTMKGVVIVR